MVYIKERWNKLVLVQGQLTPDCTGMAQQLGGAAGSCGPVLYVPHTGPTPSMHKHPRALKAHRSGAFKPWRHPYTRRSQPRHRRRRAYAYGGVDYHLKQQLRAATTSSHGNVLPQDLQGPSIDLGFCMPQLPSCLNLSASNHGLLSLDEQGELCFAAEQQPACSSSSSSSAMAATTAPAVGSDCTSADLSMMV